eukprot:CAMPEP_0118640400 /NCGR_PEP_ID=MMETSP0785-20121206/4735_1 /TAXON_ID=91992 /ORGANISM="Bolidomonas pacifica, Strain CCMP 1866" /LENGTH=511 /DNA_ID=CAMNT_0006531789 /DNA_START=24 /DNA_END=1556 /DNA_ORIENTATION=-
MTSSITTSAPSTSLMSNSSTKGSVTMRLSQLQNLCKRDPLGYSDDYRTQLNRFNAELTLLNLDPGKENEEFVELMQFVTAVVSKSYRDDGDEVANKLEKVLSDKKDELHPDTRRSLVQSLILMRNRSLIPPQRLISLFFPLFTVSDKSLRSLVYSHIVSDLKNMNKGGKREKVNRELQGFMHGMINDVEKKKGDRTREDIKARKCVDIAAELYRRNIWNDDRTVQILAQGTLSPNASIMTRCIHFFLGIEGMMDDDKEREENDEWAGVNDIDFHQHSRKTKKRQNQVMKQIANRKKAQMKREKRKLEDGMEENTPNLYPAIEQLNDPQGLAEKLLKKIKNSASNAYKFDQKLLVLNFVTRLVGVHSLILLPLYPFLIRYLGGHQKNVTNILAYVVQACHPLVPPDDVKGLLKTVAHNFITERCSEEQMAVGINAVTAVCKRVPSLLAEDDDHVNDGGGSVVDMEAFVRDIAGFTRHRDKSVSVAAKGFVNFIRVTHPRLLKGKQRGLVGAA